MATAQAFERSVRRGARGDPGARRRLGQHRAEGDHPRVDAYIDALPEWQQTAMLRQIIADNRAGGWRKLKRA